ncbi:MAG TPA: single-stranded DNA-binding protein [Candidatus Angelobacter sp.]|jgi:single-strand DNA-binding protein|nr:single-stranded DNA-binding protein [Candidatus Angelobacter sp.]
MALYENSIRLKGFLGKDPETKETRNGATLTVLSLATKSSYRRNDEWVSSTEWHRIVCFNQLADYARTLKKGDYVEVKGEIRSSEFQSAVGEGRKKTSVKRRSWEVRAKSVQKLTRTDGANAETVEEDGAA